MHLTSPFPRFVLLFACCSLLCFGPSPVSAALFSSEAEEIQRTILLQPYAPAYRLNHDDLQKLYGSRNYRPVWLTQNPADRDSLAKFISAMQAFVTFHGLQESDYPAVEMTRLLASTIPADATKLEILTTDWLIKLARDLNGARVNLSQLYVGWDFKQEPHDVVNELSNAIVQNKVHEYFDALTPTSFDYMKLADSLSLYRSIKAKGGWPAIPAGETIKPDMNDPRVPLIRQRLAAEGYAVPEPTSDLDTAYNGALQTVVTEYQVRNGLDADGNLGKKTLRAMSVPVEQRISQINANLERLRHLPHSFPDRYAVVNIANTSIKVFEKGQVIYHAPVIAGRADRKTPFMQSTIRSVIFNPSWHVPAKIARLDILPKLRKDPRYLEKMGFVIKDAVGEDMHGTTINWQKISASEFAFRLRQEPGEMNSLGRIKFDFENDFAVYMHGTPHEELFAKAGRHLSSGCVRLQDPETFAEIVLKANDGDWTHEKVQGAIDQSKTKWLQVKDPLPLYFIYQTASFPSPEGPIHFSPDDYNYDQILTNALGERTKG